MDTLSLGAVQVVIIYTLGACVRINGSLDAVFDHTPLRTFIIGQIVGVLALQTVHRGFNQLVFFVVLDTVVYVHEGVTQVDSFEARHHIKSTFTDVALNAFGLE